MKIKFRFKQKMLTLCCIPMVLLTVISLVLGLAQFKDGMYKETKSSLYSSAIAALNLYQSQGYGDYALKTDGSIIGAMMASQSADGLNSMVQRYILISVAVSCVILVAVILFIFVYIGSLTRVLHDVRRVLLKVTMGDFSTLSNDMENSSRESQEILEELLQSSRNSQETAKDIGQQVMVTNDSVQQIKSVTEYITDIAEETNLLALNASIEAARAGEADKRFAVVAEQIQKLAEQSNNSAAKIGENIQKLVDKTEGIVKAMVIIEETLKKQEESVDKTKKIFDELNTNIMNVNQKETEMQELATLMEDLTEVANKLSENLEMFLA